MSELLSVTSVLRTEIGGTEFSSSAPLEARALRKLFAYLYARSWLVAVSTWNLSLSLYLISCRLSFATASSALFASVDDCFIRYTFLNPPELKRHMYQWHRYSREHLLKKLLCCVQCKLYLTLSKWVHVDLNLPVEDSSVCQQVRWILQFAGCSIISLVISLPFIWSFPWSNDKRLMTICIWKYHACSFIANHGWGRFDNYLSFRSWFGSHCRDGGWDWAECRLNGRASSCRPSSKRYDLTICFCSVLFLTENGPAAFHLHWDHSNSFIVTFFTV